MDADGCVTFAQLRVTHVSSDCPRIRHSDQQLSHEPGVLRLYCKEQRFSAQMVGRVHPCSVREEEHGDSFKVFLTGPVQSGHAWSLSGLPIWSYSNTS